MPGDTVDVVIVGAGLSGIGSAWHLQDKCPDKTYAILESRASLGGTWDLFRYPGIRSDSDMYTLGYNFRPWSGQKSIADGASILSYLNETAAENGIADHIRFNRRVERAVWSSDDAHWTIEAGNTQTGETDTIRCRFLLICSGYYNYEHGYLPEFAGRQDFGGTIVHPQFWPQDIDYRDKTVVVIGSGATAVTLIPELAGKARHVVMLQRSPTYMAAQPDEDRIANFLRTILPAQFAYRLTRWKNIRFQQFIYRQTRKAPDKIRKRLLDMARKELGPDCGFETNFVPAYNPWDQRLCLVPNADFFRTVRQGKASVVTGTIDRFTQTGILLDSGETIEADIIVTATGLELCVMGDIEFVIDGERLNVPDAWSYKSVMFSGVPNMLATFGYINASWTLKADLTAEYACRVLTHMDSTGYEICVPELRDEDRNMPALDWIRDFSSGYIQRKIHLLPKQGDRAPWLNTQNYLSDRKLLLESPVDDGVLRFKHPKASGHSERADEPAAA